jgi:hypothetical protein
MTMITKALFCRETGKAGLSRPCLQTNVKDEIALWRTTSKCASAAPDGAVSVLLGDLKSHTGKTKPIVRWGRKAPGLGGSC